MTWCGPRTDVAWCFLQAEVADMSIGSCSLDYVFDASEVPLHQQLRREEWQTIKKTSPMLVRTVLGRDNDVHLHKETLLKYASGTDLYRGGGYPILPVLAGASLQLM